MQRRRKKNKNLTNKNRKNLRNDVNSHAAKSSQFGKRSRPNLGDLVVLQTAARCTRNRYRFARRNFPSVNTANGFTWRIKSKTGQSLNLTFPDSFRGSLSVTYYFLYCFITAFSVHSHCRRLWFCLLKLHLHWHCDIASRLVLAVYTYHKVLQS